MVSVERDSLGPRRQKLGKKVSQGREMSSPKQLPLVLWPRMLRVKVKAALVLVTLHWIRSSSLRIEQKGFMA